MPAPSLQTSYSTFLEGKGVHAPAMGFVPDALIPALKPFQQELVSFALERGRAAIFAERGLGKTIQQLSWADAVAQETGRPALILTPLAVSGQTLKEAARFGVSAAVTRGGRLPDAPVIVTNYERLEHLNVSMFGGVALDESSVLKAFMGRTKRQLVERFQKTPYRLALTATPSPNDIVELGNHAEFLGIMHPSQMLTRWFANDTTQSQTFRLKAHGEGEFFAWLAGWSRALRVPSDLGDYSDAGYLRAAPEYVVHTVQTDHSRAAEEEGALFRQVSASATSLHRELRGTLGERARRVAELVLAEPGEPWVVWAHTNAEADAIRRLVPEVREVRGNMTADEKEAGLTAFSDGSLRVLITKPSIAGWGMNWQHCRRQAFASLTYSFEELYQAVGRSDRYGQTGRVQAHLVTTDTHTSVLASIQRKQAEHTAMQERLIRATRQAGGRVHHQLTLGEAHMQTVTGPGFTLHHGDTCEVTPSRPANVDGLQVFSPPFSNLYSYSPSLRDMGNTGDDREFFEHFGFLIPELRRTLIPGRLCAVHVKNLPIYKSKSGFSGVRDFRGDVIRAFTQAAPGEDGDIWAYHSEVCIWTDPVREMQRTKRQGLLYSQLQRDSNLTSVGMPEYLLLFRKWTPECDAPAPITHTAADLPLDLWQRYASPVWVDISRTDVLNARIASTDEDEKHLAPLQLEIIRRAVHLWSNPGDLVYTPFLGVGSEAYVAVQMSRRAEGVELKREYFDWAVRNVRQMAEQAASSLFPIAQVGD
ncbi:DNA methyltransferase [uncultured Deinococcus sp.]|uniref:DNA methyltransferase n=1 Tax=uncultured Deinococcus sp. TaxID=158789 RepID=UPI002585096B|nr:DNA methyltransferase [uncultured Deinococcus sp.]